MMKDAKPAELPPSASRSFTCKSHTNAHSILSRQHLIALSRFEASYELDLLHQAHALPFKSHFSENTLTLHTGLGIELFT